MRDSVCALLERLHDVAKRTTSFDDRCTIAEAVGRLSADHPGVRMTEVAVGPLEECRYCGLRLGFRPWEYVMEQLDQAHAKVANG